MFEECNLVTWWMSIKCVCLLANWDTNNNLRIIFNYSPSSVTAMQQTCVVSGMNKNVNNNTLQVTIKNPSPTTTSNSVISNNQQPSLQKLLSTHINNHEMLPEQNTPQQVIIYQIYFKHISKFWSLCLILIQ